MANKLREIFSRSELSELDVQQNRQMNLLEVEFHSLHFRIVHFGNIDCLTNFLGGLRGLYHDKIRVRDY